ncbi:hypothetical protein HU200_010811 [Digitaria exilis]|uniref:[RNA-polymerase]-subunit kinase n=1 Tax=Digitaria exilis TaxID=1010633 RepID=A0A835FHH2_9POAL|nr:hypothetical protein HU200_010811 [Digitaria exilis]
MDAPVNAVQGHVLADTGAGREAHQMRRGHVGTRVLITRPSTLCCRMPASDSVFRLQLSFRSRMASWLPEHRRRLSESDSLRPFPPPSPPFPPLVTMAAAGVARHHAAPQPTRKRMRVAMGTTDDYEEEEGSFLGEGGFGNVVRARHRATGQPVAIKRLRAGEDQTALLRESLFLKAASARNPFVVGSQGLARNPSTLELCLVMECGGTSLDDALRVTPPLSEATVRAAMWQLLTGAKKMHDAHIMHRDIKPENILVGDDDQVLRFCDYGLAVYMAEPPPYDQAGTLGYMAPEMLLGKTDYDALVDTWSLGCVMAELINGGSPLFEGVDCPHQLCDIFKLLGVPDEKAWPWFASTPFANKMAGADKHSRLREMFPVETLRVEVPKDGLRRHLTWNQLNGSTPGDRERKVHRRRRLRPPFWVPFVSMGS